MTAALHGLAVIAAVLAIAGGLVVALSLWETDWQDRQQRRRDLDGVDEWEQVKRDLGPRSQS